MLLGNDAPVPAETGDDSGLPTGWRGPIMPVNTESGDRRVIVLDGDEVPLRPLPLPLEAQREQSEGGHVGALVVGLITRAWLQDGMVWGEGPFDLADEDGREWAARVGRGMAGWVSADLSDTDVEEVPLKADGTPWDRAEYDAAWAEFEAALLAAEVPGQQPPEDAPQPPEVSGYLMRVTNWRLMGATMVSGPAFEDARILPVYGEEFTSVNAAETLAASAAEHTGAMIALVPSQEDAARLAVQGYEPVEELHVTLAFLGEAAAWTPEARDALEVSVAELGIGVLDGSAWGQARFNPLGEACSVYLVEAPGLVELHDAAIGAVEDTAGVPSMPEQHPTYIPHLTVGYGMDPALVLDGFGPVRFDRVRLAFGGDVRDIPLTAPDEPEALVAAGGAVWARDDFEIPEADEPTALTVTEDGRVFGHLAAWGTCHIGHGECVTPPPGVASYARFHQKEIQTDRGMLRVGKLTMGTGHAGEGNAQAAAAHYDNTGTLAAVVRCSDGQYGPWLSGRVVPWLDAQKREEFALAAVSGDWRARRGEPYELIAALCVNVPGFPIPAARALAASGFESLTAATVVRHPIEKVREAVVAAAAPRTEDDVRRMARAMFQEFSDEKTREASVRKSASRMAGARASRAAARVKAAEEYSETRITEQRNAGAAAAAFWAAKGR
jgi:2'-5' RNA ligase